MNTQTNDETRHSNEAKKVKKMISFLGIVYLIYGSAITFLSMAAGWDIFQLDALVP